jgi:hypothetical protein
VPGYALVGVVGAVDGDRVGRGAPMRRIAYAAVVAATAAGLYGTQKHGTDEVRAGQVKACERGNIVRGYLLLRAEEESTEAGASRTTRLAPSLFPILDCHTGRPLTPLAAATYIQQLQAGHP